MASQNRGNCERQSLEKFKKKGVDSTALWRLGRTLPRRGSGQCRSSKPASITFYPKNNCWFHLLPTLLLKLGYRSKAKNYINWFEGLRRIGGKKSGLHKYGGPTWIIWKPSRSSRSGGMRTLCSCYVILFSCISLSGIE